MNDYNKLQHSVWECKYHIVFIPKYRKKTLFGVLRRDLGSIFKKLAQHKESKIEEGYVMKDHIHMLVSIPPKNSVANVVGYIKGKSAIHIARTYQSKTQNFTGESFWARGYFVSTVGRDEAKIRDYIRNQEKENIRVDQLKLFKK